MFQVLQLSTGQRLLLFEYVKARLVCYCNVDAGSCSADASPSLLQHGLIDWLLSYDCRLGLGIEEDEVVFHSVYYVAQCAVSEAGFNYRSSYYYFLSAVFDFGHELRILL